MNSGRTQVGGACRAFLSRHQTNNSEEMKMTRSVLFASATTAMISVAGAASADCGEVVITEMDWASAQVVTSVAKFLMEQGYGCTVDVVPSSTVPSLASIAETGKPDIVTELWTNGAPAWAEMEAEGKIVTLTDVLSDGGAEGWWIPDYLAEAHPELLTIDGVTANPELIGARFHQCPEGWGCQRANASKAEAYGLIDAEIEVFQHGSSETLATSIASAYANQEPWFGYYWGPTAILGKYPMVQVDMGDASVDIHNCDSDPDCPTRGTERSAYPASPVKTVVTTTFAEENPEITDLMRNLAFTNQQMNEILAWREDNQASSEEAAVHFLSNSTEVWSAWISDEAKENLAFLLDRN